MTEFTHTNFDFENEYPKLIRDNIPSIIKQREGREADVRVAVDDMEYIVYLLKKIGEESKELQKSLEVGNAKEEIADVLEIIDALVKMNGWDMQEIKNLQEEKRKKNGGFEKRLIMKNNKKHV